MINYIDHKEGIKRIAQLLVEEKIIPIFGAGFSKSSIAYNGMVPDGKQSRLLMKTIILKFCPDLNEEDLENYDFSDMARRFRKLTPRCIPEKEYVNFFQNYFTEVSLSQQKIDFLKLPWPYIFTINIDDGIERTGLFNSILPYHNARNNISSAKPKLFKLHGDAKYELHYKEKNIIFDSDQYTQSLIDPDNQTMRESIANTYKEFNLLFIGCSLHNEPDIKYIYNRISNERFKTMGITLKKEKLKPCEEDDLEDYGITDVVLVKDYDLFYIDLNTEVMNLQIENKRENFQFFNPKILYDKDEKLKFFSGYRSFDEKKNSFHKSSMMIERDILEKVQKSLEQYNIVFIEGRRFSGKTSLLCSICENEKRRSIFFFPSTTQENCDLIYDIISNYENSLLVFDSNALSSEGYYLLQDITDKLDQNDNKIVIALNQSDNYLPELIESDYIKLSGVFSENELPRLKYNTDRLGLTERKGTQTNLDYLNIIKKEQIIPLSMELNLPKEYTCAEQILILLLGVKDKIYSRDILSLNIRQVEVVSFLQRVSFLCEWIPTAYGEKNTYSTYKLVHNSKNIILDEIRKIEHDDVITCIIRIVQSFKKGDSNQKRIYKEVMQFDTLNQLFGRKRGAGRLIFRVYEELEQYLYDDLHFWLQRSKSIYRLTPSNYSKLQKSYSYAKKVYLDTNNDTLATKASLSISLICSLLYPLEGNPVQKREYLEEAIQLGYKAIFSEYYKQEKRLNNDLNFESQHNNYANLMRKSCAKYMEQPKRKREIENMTRKIMERLPI